MSTKREKSREKGLHLLFHITVSERYRSWYKQQSVLLLPCCEIAWGSYWYGRECRLSIAWLVFQVDLYTIKP